MSIRLHFGGYADATIPDSLDGSALVEAIGQAWAKVGIDGKCSLHDTQAVREGGAPPRSRLRFGPLQAR